jgi:hypothetical protein
MRLVNSQVETSMWLLGGDGEPYVFCENSILRQRPCDERIRLDVDRQPVTGIKVNLPYSRSVHLFCSYRCLARYARKFQ